MEDKEKQIQELREYIKTVEGNLESAKAALLKLSGDYDFSKAKEEHADGKIIEGIFDGENMLGPDGQIYPVPANYASKSKLVEGDRLKLTIAGDGSFIFKQIGPIERKKVIGTLNFEDNAYNVTAEGKKYNVIYASVTYYKAQPGDRVTIVVPASEDSKWAAMENVIREPDKDVDGIKPILTGMPEEAFVNLPDEEKNNLGEDLTPDESV